MSGFPSRISRDTLGPELEDLYPTDNPSTDIPAAAFNTMFHQVAGLNVAMPTRAVAVVAAAGTVLHQGEAWNSNGDQAHPVIAKTGTGTYTMTFASSYLDETGSAVATSLLFAEARFLGDMSAWANKVDAFAWVSGLVVYITTWTAATGAAVDAKFKVEVA